MRKKIAVILVLVMTCLLFSGCGKNTSAPDIDDNGLKVNDVVSGPVNPLTGEPVDKDESEMRPYCVMINNHPDARPCIGLSNASIIYEALAEGGITRMMAVFTDVNDITIGSIRSSRPYYISLAQSYDAIYVHAGGSDQAYSDMASLGIDHIDGVRGGRPNEASIYYRDQARLNEGRNLEHTLFATGSKIASFAKDNFELKHSSDYDTTYGLVFSPDAASQCKNASTDFKVHYSAGFATEFKYNAEKKCYNAYIDGKEYYDGGNDSSIDLTNVIILNVPTKSIDSYGRQEMEVTGTGTGYFCCGGNYIEINWSRDNRADNFHYTLKDGTPLALGIGKTYICIAPLDSTDGVNWNAA